jgi:type I restriction-modification system DNA methylase subunit
MKKSKMDSINFQTPIPICDYMISLIPESAKSILEPTPGDNHIVDRLKFKGYTDITYPDDFFCLNPDLKFDCVIMNPPFSAKYAYLHNAPPHIVDYKGMRLGYFFLLECMKKTNNIIK